MKQKNTEASVGVLVTTGLLLMIVFLMAGALLVGLFRGKFWFIDPDQPLPGQLLRWAIPLGCGILIFKNASSSLWLWWTELRNTARSARVRARGWWKKPLTALVLLALIASGPWLIPIRLEGCSDPVEFMLLYAVYLFFAGLVTILPCALIYGLGRSLAEKEMEKEEQEEAKKY